MDTKIIIFSERPSSIPEGGWNETPTGSLS